MSGASGRDQGNSIYVSANYCDRTPGSVNDFVYTFSIKQNGSVLATESYSASQTHACNSISLSFADNFGIGTYEVVARVDNLTNNASGTATGFLSVIN